MGNGWHEWPLVLFTVLGQSVAGAIIVSGLGWLSLNNNSEARQRLVRGMFFIWLIMGIGFLASIIHLGSPLRAFNALNRVGSSALSNEIASGALFFAVGGFWWLVTILGKMPRVLAKARLLLTMLLGCLFVLEMTMVYQIDTVPTWYNAYTTAAFFLTMVLCGPLFAALLLRVANVPFNGRVFASMSVLALLASGGRHIAEQRAGGDPQLRTAGQRTAALLWLAANPAVSSFGAGSRLLDLPAGKTPESAHRQLVARTGTGDARRVYRPRPVLWSPYDRGYGDCRLINGCCGTLCCKEWYDAIARPRRCRTQRPHAGRSVLFAPDSEQAAPLVATLRDGSWRSQWPYAVTDGLAALFAREDDEPLPEAWQRLFIGPWALPAPPWGSVWLDKESVLFGDSTLALREWMRATGIALSEQRSEPEDHFGTLLLLAAAVRICSG